MNQKKNTKIILILIIIVCAIILIAGAAFAYLATDLFKSDKELFFQNVSSLLETKNQLIEYCQKQKTNPYTNQGTFSVHNTSENNQKQVEAMNNFNISFSGEVDKQNNDLKQEVVIKYSDDVNFPFTYQQKDNTIGLQTKYVGSKIIAIETNQLDQLPEQASRSSQEIVEKVGNLQEGIEQFLESVNNLSNTNIEAFKQQLEPSKFSSITNGDKKGYQLRLTVEECQSYLEQLLQALENKQISAKDIFQEGLEGNVEIKIYTGDILEITTENETIRLEKMIENNQLKLKISYEPKEETNKIVITASYDGLEAMENITETYEIELQTDQDSQKYEYTNQINFVETTEIEEFDERNSMILTNYPKEQVENFLNAVKERLTQVNKQQMEQLNLKEEENPILLMVTQIRNFLKGSGIALQNEMSELEVNAFNQKFEIYEGTNQKAQTVKGLLSILLLHNEEAKEKEPKIEEIHFNGEEYEATEQNITFIKEDINIEKNYRVEFEKREETGIIYRTVINEK